MRWFVKEDSVVRQIWGKPDTVLFIFAGAAAEFALNKAVDWLYFTGRLPADPLGRLFSTVSYARQIVFSEEDKAHSVIDRMSAIHQQVEANRMSKIPDWAYRDVLYMLIDYSIRAHELFTGAMSRSDKEEVYDVFRRVGARMNIPELPLNYSAWLPDRDRHIENDLAISSYSTDLFKQYRKHLGIFRYFILRAAQGIIVPEKVRRELQLTDSIVTRFLIFLYRQFAKIRLDWFFKSLILPPQYYRQVRALEYY